MYYKKEKVKQGKGDPEFTPFNPPGEHVSNTQTSLA